mgnify:CR=1 FL=1
MSEQQKEPVDYGVAIQVFADRIAPFILQFAKVAVPVVTALAKVLPQIAEELKTDWKAWVEKLDSLPAESKAAMAVASERGWFFGWHTGLTDLIELVDRISNIAPEEIDGCMIDYYSLNFEAFTEQICSTYPERAVAIGAASKAHLEFGSAGYYLSTPVFIAQADGLLSEFLGVESPLGIAREKKGEAYERLTTAGYLLKKKFESDPESLDRLAPFFTLHDSDFLKSGPAREASTSPGSTFTALNRHQVMHGERSDYGSEQNSLKSFSLLVFIGLHLRSVDQEAALREHDAE